MSDSGFELRPCVSLPTGRMIERASERTVPGPSTVRGRPPPFSACRRAVRHDAAHHAHDRFTGSCSPLASVLVLAAPAGAAEVARDATAAARRRATIARAGLLPAPDRRPTQLGGGGRAPASARRWRQRPLGADRVAFNGRARRSWRRRARVGRDARRGRARRRPPAHRSTRSRAPRYRGRLRRTPALLPRSRCAPSDPQRLSDGGLVDGAVLRRRRRPAGSWRRGERASMRSDRAGSCCASGRGRRSITVAAETQRRLAPTPLQLDRIGAADLPEQRAGGRASAPAAPRRCARTPVRTGRTLLVVPEQGCDGLRTVVYGLRRRSGHGRSGCGSAAGACARSAPGP